MFNSLELVCLITQSSKNKMVRQFRFSFRSAITSVASSFRPFFYHYNYQRGSPFTGVTDSFSGFLRARSASRTVNCLLEKLVNTKTNDSIMSQGDSVSQSEFSMGSLRLAQAHRGFKVQTTAKMDDDLDLFEQMKQRFLSFKKHKYLKELEHFQNLAEVQMPKFMVIACADSRVCPSNILGFQPGEAFMIRTVANLVPPFDRGPTETNAALEFAVNTLKVENIFVIGHSCCAGIQSLMTMHDDANSSSVEKWVANAKAAKSRTKAEAAHLSFDQQCKHCEKESINFSLRNLLTYPWIEEKVRNEELFVHGGYYDFLNCTFEKWSLKYKEDNKGLDGRISFKERTFWS